MKRLSSRFHLAVGLCSLVLSMLLLALYAGVVPDRDGAVRAGRLALAESLAAASSALMDEQDDAPLRSYLAFVMRRNSELQSVGIRRVDGVLLHELGNHSGGWRAQRASLSTDTQLVVPIVQGAARWGHAELRFAPLRPAGAWGAVMSPAVQLIGVVVGGCFVLFYFYLRRMLRHLDPSRSIPGRVRTAFDTLAEGLLVLDPDGRIVLANQAFCDVVGQSAETQVGRLASSLPWTDASDVRVRAADTPWSASLADGRQRHNVVLSLADSAAKRRTFMANCSPVPGAGGRPAGVLVSLDDVTQLEEKEIELRIARDDAQAANRAKSEFLANMSHEIRTPMNSILGFTEVLRRGWRADAAESRRHLDIIHGSATHLLELINDILDLSKIESGRLEVERVPCAAHSIVAEVLRALGVRAQEKGVALQVDFAHALPASILCDPARLRQIVTNLVGNAIKFTHQGTVGIALRIASEAPGAPLEIEISDTGIGIPADKLDAIFEPFVQAEASTTRRFGGTGLGLSISRRYARALGGDITVRSNAGRGSTFRVTLETGPLEGVEWLQPEQLNAEPIVQIGAEASAWRFAPAHVLVVDDGPENRELVRLVLEAAGLRVSEAEHGGAALQFIAANPVDLVLMDMQMQVMDGSTATRRLRERGCSVPIIALTAHAMKGYETEARAAGFTGWLTKPVDIDAMLELLATHLDGRRTDSAGAATATPPDAAAPQAPARAGTSDAEPIVSRLATHARLRRVVRNFALQLPAKIDAIDHALTQRDWDELASLGHWLKGAGGTVGYDVFFEPARDLELHARAGDLDAVAQEVARLRSLVQRIVVPNADEADKERRNALLPAGIPS